mmetsp:Transcript_49079/g.116818  ORF Transcript_49079/g.116818 Transcript_49079/m.116818 type:complete len:671 (-) Transcript_49079:34-2046(-)
MGSGWSSRKRASDKEKRDSIKIALVRLEAANNRTRHHTSSFEDESLFLRRGDSFNIGVQLAPPFIYSQAEAKCRLILTTKHGDKIELAAEILKYSEGNLSVSITIPPNCNIGRFSGRVEYECSQKKAVYEVQEAFTILFNPWCKDDETFLSDHDLLLEYILRDQGFVYRSMHAGKAQPTSWHFDQFDKEVCDCTLKLLERLPWAQRSSAVFVSRHMSAVVNSIDEAGLLVGNWSGDYSNGKAPWEWSGSSAILKKYLDTNKPVKYGQCWVFAGVLTTVLRSLGIPARPVTNFSSAHDTDATRHVEYYYDGDQKLSKSSDSVWNFHVWTEAWMTRPELPGDCNGWQAVDATPQEASGGLYQMGPAPVAAVKRGQRCLYDTDFVIAEVNADIKVFRKTPQGTFELEAVLTDRVGKLVATKQPGSSSFLDLTPAYKHSEGSTSERVSVLRTARRTEAHDVQFAATASAATMGEDLSLELKGSQANAESGARTVHAQVRLRATAYHGRASQLVSELDVGELTVPFEKSLVVPVAEYGKFLQDSGFWFEWEIHAMVQETKQVFADEVRFELEFAEPLSVKMPSQCRLGSSVEAIVSFTNPFRELTLTNGLLQVESATRALPRIEQQVPDLPPDVKGREMRVTLQPKAAGTLVVNFELDFKQLTDVQTFAELIVQA